MALGTEVVDLVGLHLLDDPDQVGAVGEVAVVQHQAWWLSLMTNIMRILAKVIDPCGVVCEAGRRP